MTKMMREIGVAEDLLLKSTFSQFVVENADLGEEKVIQNNRCCGSNLMIRWFTLVYSPGFVHHHHHVGDDGFVVEDYDCDGNVGDDDDLGVTLVFKDTKRNMDFVSDFKKTRKYLYELLE